MKFLIGVVLSVLFVANTALAMTFSKPVAVGKIGFPVQAPYHGFLVEGADKISEPEGEFRFKWDDKAQWFGVEQIVY